MSTSSADSLPELEWDSQALPTYAYLRRVVAVKEKIFASLDQI